MMAIVLGLVLFLGLTSNENFAIGLQIFVIIMLSIWAITNFCPSIWVLKKILPPCKWEK
jgi:Na+-translocating ferredoxin:NAD+ oxidoreductase RnfA subunit